MSMILIIGATVCKTVHPVLSDSCPIVPCTVCLKRWCGQTAEWIKMPLGTKVGLCPGHIVLNGDPALPHGKGHSSPQFSAHVYCGQKRAAWIKMPLGTEV